MGVTDLKEIRCRKCLGLLLRGSIIDVEIKCRECGYVNRVWTSDTIRFEERKTLNDARRHAEPTAADS